MRIKRIGDVALSVAALLGMLGILLGVAVAMFGVTPLVFRSGSMSPAIEAGDLAFARNVRVKDLRVGDIVSVRTDGTRVTHRVVAVDGRQLRLKGDANNVMDAEPYTVTSADRVFAHVPKLGYAIVWAMSPLGLVVSGAFAALLLFLALGSGGSRDPGSGTDAEKSPAGASRSTDSDCLVGRSLIAVVGVVTFVVTSTTTLAFWTDTAAVSASISSAPASRPTFTDVKCTVAISDKNGNTFRLSWPAVSGASEYQIYSSALNASATGTPRGGSLDGSATTGIFQVKGNEKLYAYVVAQTSSGAVRSNAVEYDNFKQNPVGSGCL